MPKQPFVPVGQVLKIRLSGTNQTHPWVNGFHVKYSGAAPDQTALNTFAGLFGQAWMSYIAGVASDVIHQNECQVWDLSADTGAEGIDQTPHNGQVAAGPMLPASACIVVSWPVQQRWRGGHFRTYHPFANAANVTNGSQIVDATATAVQQAFLAFLGGVNQIPVNAQPVQLGGVRYFPAGTNPDGTPITRTSGSFLAFGTPIVRHRIDTQRRRLGKELV